ncbi:MAG TPA: alpha-mannosidase, partial [Ktedonobacterales bacterium]|nr:alpha-mannosidase [Ktedonobacterales bacterium]
MRPSMQRVRRATQELAWRMYSESLLLRDLHMLELGSGIPPQEAPIPARDRGDWKAVHPGSHWGGYDQTAWFHAETRVPEGWIAQLDDGQHAVVLRLLLGIGTEFGWPEGLLYVNGRLHQGINRHHPDVLLRADDVRGGSLAFDARVWSGMLPDDHRIETAEIALLDRPTERLYHLLVAGSDLVDALDESNLLLYSLAQVLDETYNRVVLSSGGFYDSVCAAVAYVESALDELAQRLHADRPVVTAVGHGHLDVAWLWQTRHTREKTARTFAVATALMDAYPEYVFLHTTPQVFDWLERDYPELFDRVKRRVDEGRFEAAGAMWVESDCNLVSGESLVRQILYGQRFLHEKFGREYNALWLPDAFGYSAALPQIMLRAGIPVFMTTKMSWSETNRIPADTFHWRGIDGSTVLAHFITTPTLGAPPLFANMDTYNGALNVEAVRGVWERYRQKSLSGETLLAFGHGDGGAGPTRQQLEHARALRRLPGMPELRLGRADEFFDRLRMAVARTTEVPVWDGELYLEYHRGTYTTQSWLKRTHRQLEATLLLVEWLDAWQWTLQPDSAPDSAPDRRELLDDAWRTLLMHEFHDILPGSSIATVYWDARMALTALAQNLEALTSAMLTALAADVPNASSVVLNPSPFARRDVVMPAASKDGLMPHIGGIPLPTQQVGDGPRPTILAELPELLGRSTATIEWAAPSSAAEPAAAAEDVAVTVDGDGIVVSNAFFTVTLNGSGEIASLRDHRASDKELIPNTSAGNRLTAFEDLPRDFDAWDVDAFYAQKPYSVDTVGISVVERGPLRAAVRIERRFRSSTIIQRMVCYRAIPRIDFETQIDWHEHHVLLKADFPLDIHATHATCETQYGVIERPLHRNTSWDRARFEIPAHRWLDLSDADYGVSLLNDGRYGHDVADGHIGLTLLRSPTWPDPQADQGAHELIYSLYPHPDGWQAGGTTHAAYALNRPLVIHDADASGGNSSRSGEGASMLSAIMFESEADGVVIEAIKRSQAGLDLIVRVYETWGRGTEAGIRSSLSLAELVECDLLERPLTPENSPAHALWLASAAAS